jgi:hypothetical protein
MRSCLSINRATISLHLSHRERSTREARRVRGYSLSRVLDPLTPTLSPMGRGRRQNVRRTRRSNLDGGGEETAQPLLPHLVMPAHHEVRASDVMVRRRLRVYDETIRVLKPAVANARLGRDEELAALQRLDAQARALECEAEGPSVEAVIATEMAQSHALGGRSVFGWEPPPAWDRKTG